MNVLDEIVKDQLRTDLPELASGDTVKVSAKVVEGNRERIQVFEGTVMRLRGGGITRTITVRRIASGVGVERTFKINSPRIEKIEVVRHGVARRAQLYFLRKRVGKAATLRERRPSWRLDRASAVAGAGAAPPPPVGGRLPWGRWRRSSRPSASSAALARGPDPRRRRRRGRRRAGLRAGRRGGRDHAAGLQADPGRARLEDAVGRPARAAGGGHPAAGGRGRGRRGLGRRDRPPEHLPRHPPGDAPGDRPARRPRPRPASTACGSAASRRTSGRTPRSSTATRRCYSIACASVVAKVVRDRLMTRLAARHPGYGWEHNAGLRHAPSTGPAMSELGLTPFHRRSFITSQRVLFGGEQADTRARRRLRRRAADRGRRGRGRGDRESGRAARSSA